MRYGNGRISWSQMGGLVENNYTCSYVCGCNSVCNASSHRVRWRWRQQWQLTYLAIRHRLAQVRSRLSRRPDSRKTARAGYTGTWTQTRSYSAAAYPTCWVAGSWTPNSCACWQLYHYPATASSCPECRRRYPVSRDHGHYRRGPHAGHGDDAVQQHRSLRRRHH